MRHLRGAPLALALLLCGCPGPGGGAPTPQPTRGAQERPDPRRAQAMEAAKALGEQLKARLGQAIQEGGLGAGIETCKVAAPAIGTKLSGERSLRLGRTSFKLRNPANAVPTWAQAEVDARRETPSFSEGPDGTLRALLPIRMAGLCVACHGPRESLSQEVQEALAQRYPEDRATGFGEGELRGWFWVEVPQE